MTRPDWTDYFMGMAKLVATRSTCLRRRVGCVITKDNHVLSTGFNGAVCGAPHCGQYVDCMRNELQIPSGEQLQQCWGAHAEQNAVAQAARHGISLEGATAYVTIQPCSMCAKSLINAGVKEIHYAGAYPDQLTQSLLTHANVNVVRKDAQ